MKKFLFIRLRYMFLFILIITFLRVTVYAAGSDNDTVTESNSITTTTETFSESEEDTGSDSTDTETANDAEIEKEVSDEAEKNDSVKIWIERYIDIKAIIAGIIVAVLAAVGAGIKFLGSTVLKKRKAEKEQAEKFKQELESFKDNFYRVTKQVEPSTSRTCDPLHFSCAAIGCYGREDEYELLDGFRKADEKVLYWAVTGPGGTGKSKFVFSYFQNHKSDADWLYAYISKDSLSELKKHVEGDTPFNIFLAADYAGSMAEEIGQFISSLTVNRKNKIRVLLLERQNKEVMVNDLPIRSDWYKRFNCNSNLESRLYMQDAFLQLPFISDNERLESVYKHQIKNTLGDIRLCDLTPSIIQSVIDNYACPENDEDLALALSSLKKFKEQVNACLKVAVVEDLLTKNPCSMVVLPNKYCVVTPTKKQLSLSDEQIEDLKNACLSKYKSRDEYRSRDGLVLLVILALGLRVGEALALNWSDFNLDKKIVYIRKTVQYSKKNGAIVKDGTKTDAGERILPINDNVIFYLNKLKEYDKRNQIRSKIVCCTSTGSRQNARNLQRSLTRILGRTEIEDHVSLHTLRHTFGSCLLRKGVMIEVVSKLMGHSSITIT